MKYNEKLGNMINLWESCFKYIFYEIPARLRLLVITLFKYAFTKKVYYRNTFFNVSVGDYVTETGIDECCSCTESFRSKQGLSPHVLWAHPASISINKSEVALKVINAKI